MEYKPRKRRRGINQPFGYYVSPLDQNVLIPDPRKLDSLHYAFRMRAKYKTPIRDCTQWLHAATGQRMTPAGFHLAYKTWINKLKKERLKEVAVKKAEIKKNIEETHKQFQVTIPYGHDDITALAYNEAKEAYEKRK